MTEPTAASHFDQRGLRKAAILLTCLDTDLAVEICSQLDAETVRVLATEIARLSAITQEERDEVIREFVASMERFEMVDGQAKARELLKNVLGRDDDIFALEEAEGLQQLDRLRDLDPPVLWRYLQDELPQTITVLLAYLQPQKAAAVLALMPEELRTQIIVRMGRTGTLAPGAMEALAEGVRELTHTVLSREVTAETTTPQFIADIISNMDVQSQKAALEALRQHSPGFAQMVEELVFTFEDVLRLDDRSLQIVLRNLDSRTIALALKNVPDDAKERILSNMSSRAREAILQEMELMGQVRVRDVEAAQREFAQVARELAEKGEITLTAGEEEYI